MKKIVVILAVFCFVSTAGLATESEEGVVSSPAGALKEDPFGEDLLGDDLLDSEFDEFDEEEYAENSIFDPLEPLNRVFFEFNDKLYFWVLKPVKQGYSFVMPEELRQCVGNFFNNLAAPIRLINNLLQGRFEDAGIVVSRFFINSTIGVYGLADVALQEFNLDPRLADFGQTLGVYGLGEGIYICWPILGPSNLRDTVGLAGDTLASPIYSPIINPNLTITENVLYYSVNNINFLSLTPDVYEDLKTYSLDPYVATRQSFYDFRRNVIKRARSEETDF